MDSSVYRALLEEEWDDPSADDDVDIREQLELDKDYFRPYLVCDNHDIDGLEEDDLTVAESDNEEIDILAIEMEMEMESLNINGDEEFDSDCSQDYYSPEEENTDDLDGLQNSCVHRCLSQFDADSLLNYHASFKALKQSRRRQLLQPLLACHCLLQ